MSFFPLALVATVAVLLCMGFFMLGSLPLLVLNHDTPLDANFIRGLFNLYYRALLVTSGAATVAYAFAGIAAFSIGMGALAFMALVVHRGIVQRMDAVRANMTATDADAISRFRRLHVGGMLLNVLQIGALATAMGVSRLAF